MNHTEVARVVKKRIETIKTVYADPYIGYSSLQEATDDCLASSQAEVMSRLLSRENLFISGPAGSGKTTIIKRFIDLIDASYNGNFNIAVTASTGLAASLIEGRTIHSWSGLGIFEGVYKPNSKDKNDFKVNFFKTQHLRYVDVLIIDEISMLHAYYLDNLDTLLKYVRRNNKPFGGVQVVFLGDFMQLPPVSPRNPKDDVNYGYAITSKAWKEANITYCYMDKIHRASDPDLKHLLRTIESSKVDSKSMQIISKCQNNKRDKNKSYTTLFTTNKNVDAYNDEQLAKNPNPATAYHASTTGKPKDVERLMKSRNIRQVTELKVGTTVIVTSNITDDFSELIAANGSVGKVTSLTRSFAKVLLNNGKTALITPMSYSESKKLTVPLPDGTTMEMDEVTATVTQIPLKLGYAITVHKSQGQTFDGVEVDLSNCFTPGLGYVALSRVTSSDNLMITNFNQESLEVGTRSKKISTYVKRRALETRKSLIANISAYESLLTDEIALNLYWDVNTAGAIRNKK